MRTYCECPSVIKSTASKHWKTTRGLCYYINSLILFKKLWTLNYIANRTMYWHTIKQLAHFLSSLFRLRLMDSSMPPDTIRWFILCLYSVSVKSYLDMQFHFWCWLCRNTQSAQPVWPDISANINYCLFSNWGSIKKFWWCDVSNNNMYKCITGQELPGAGRRSVLFLFANSCCSTCLHEMMSWLTS